MSHLFVLSMALVALPALGGSEPSKLRLVVVPFASLSGHIPLGAGAKAHSMLVTELKSTGAFTVVVEPKQQINVDSAREALVKARAHVEKAKTLRAKHQIPGAAAALASALEAYTAAATALPDVNEVVDCYTLASAVAYAAGRDEDGQRALSSALALAPDRELPLAKTSPLFARVVAEARRALEAGPKGALLVSSTPSNAPVTLDGHLVGATPLSMQDVPPGPHLWTAALSTGETVGGVVEVTAGRTAELIGRPSRLDATARLLDVVAKNRLDEAVVVAARELARESQAELVVFGALSAEGKGLALDAFALASDASGGASGDASATRRLPRRSFDVELLSAGMELFGLAGELAQSRAALGALVPLPARVSESLTGAVQVTEAKYGAPAKAPSTGAIDAASELPAAPVGPRRRVPLKTR